MEHAYFIVSDNYLLYYPSQIEILLFTGLPQSTVYQDLGNLTSTE
jgi:hypothetical protein